MAGEKRGIAFEALLALAFDDLLGDAKGKEVYWNIKPEGMSIDPDFTIGPNPNSPESLFLVSYPEAYLNSGFKFWRNVAETWQAKVLLSSKPRVIGVQFGDGMKGDLLSVSKYVFDSFLHVSSDSGYPKLLSTIEESAPNLPPEKEKKKGVIRDLISGNDAVQVEYCKFKRALKSSSSAKNSISERIWTAAANYYSSKVKRSRRAHLTSFRRAFAKLMLAENADEVIESAKNGAIIRQPGSFGFLGFAKKTAAGFRLQDDEIERLVRQCDRSLIDGVLSNLDRDQRLQTLIAPFRNTDAIRVVTTMLIKNWSQWSDPELLFQEMRKCHSDGLAYVHDLGAKRVSYTRPGLVAELVFEAIREILGKNQAFGNKVLITGLVKQSKVELERDEVERVAKKIGGLQGGWRAATTVSYGYRDWVFGDDRTNFTLSDFELLRIAFVIAQHIPPCSGRKPVELEASIIERWAHNQFTNRIACYREFRPLDILLEASLTNLGHAWEEVLYYPSVWREVALANGELLNRRSATSTVYRVGKTLIRTQSVTDSGATHKKKELCARAVGLRHVAEGGGVAIRDVKLILLIDGCFDNSDLKVLYQAGWDEIFYPHEMDNLAKAIV